MGEARVRPSLARRRHRALDRSALKTPDFTFVTYEDLPDLDPDDRLAVDALARRGLRATPAVWNDPDVDWSRAGVVVIRSTWDYHLDHEGFLSWAARVSNVAPLWNPLPMLRWNVHKGYLLDIAARGAPVIETEIVRAGTGFDLASLLERRGWRAGAVIKPAVGLATRGVMRVEPTSAGVAAAQAHAEALLADHDMLVQPFVASIERYPERALVFIAGAYSHAASKIPFQPLAVVGAAGERAVIAEPEEIEIATRVARMVEGDPLYVRVDLVRGDHGEPRVIELELIEPSLFLSLHPAAADRFASALAALL